MHQSRVSGSRGVSITRTSGETWLRENSVDALLVGHRGAHVVKGRHAFLHLILGDISEFHAVCGGTGESRADTVVAVADAAAAVVFVRSHCSSLLTLLRRRCSVGSASTATPLMLLLLFGCRCLVALMLLPMTMLLPWPPLERSRDSGVRKKDYILRQHSRLYTASGAGTGAASDITA